MSVAGRTTKRWGRDKSARWDPGPTNRSRSYPPVPQPTVPVPDEPKRVELLGRPGAAERQLVVEWLGGGLMIALHGWYPDIVTLSERQVAFLRDTLNAWFDEGDPA